LRNDFAFSSLSFSGILSDEEGIETVRHFAKNVAHILKKLKV